MGEKRNLDFYCSRGTDLSLDKSRFVELFESKYGIKQEEMAFVGDDYFDLSMFKKLKYTFSPLDAPMIIKQNSHKVINCLGGQGVVVRLYDYFIESGWITDATEEEVAELDKKEATSSEMA